MGNYIAYGAESGPEVFKHSDADVRAKAQEDALSTALERMVPVATNLADEDYRRMHALVARRRGASLTQQDVADQLGWTVDDVKDFEAYWGDPTLSEIRRYTLCVVAAEKGLDVE